MIARAYDEGIKLGIVQCFEENVIENYETKLIVQMVPMLTMVLFF